MSTRSSNLAIRRDSLTIDKVLDLLPLIVAPVVLFVFTLVTAYVFKFGLPRTGIHFDFVLLAIVVVVSLVIGGAL